jgi:hypothetical protein
MSRYHRDPSRRGMHKKNGSRETRIWVREHMEDAARSISGAAVAASPPLPAQPPWMSIAEYQRLAELRERL